MCTLVTSTTVKLTHKHTLEYSHTVEPLLPYTASHTHTHTACDYYFIGASLSEPHLGPYSGCGLCHIIMIMIINISYVLAPVYKRLYFIRDMTYVARTHALRTNVQPAHWKFKGHQNLQRVRTLQFTSVSSWLCGSASHRRALIIVWQLAMLLKEVRTSSLSQQCLALH